LTWYLIPAVIGAGFLAGFINTLAGSGSLVTLPMLIFVGLPATVANGTNRVAIVLQNIVAGTSFYRRQLLDPRGILVLGAPAVIGSITGAQIAVNLNETMMRRSIGVVMVIMLVVILVRPQRWLQGSLERLEGRPTLLQVLIFFGIGLYGGFIQAGVGIFLLAGLVLSVGYDLVRANAIKIGIVLFFTLFALAVFIINGQVDWIVGLILAIGNMLGAWVAARVAAEKGAVWVRRLLVAIVILSAADLLGIVELAGRFMN
jgi:uncharacterized membrane protein YfcA